MSGRPDQVPEGGDRPTLGEDDEYRHADPRELVEEDSVAMSGPAGAPQEERSVEQRRRLDRETD